MIEAWSGMAEKLDRQFYLSLPNLNLNINTVYGTHIDHADDRANIKTASESYKFKRTICILCDFVCVHVNMNTCM